MRISLEKNRNLLDEAPIELIERLNSTTGMEIIINDGHVVAGTINVNTYKEVRNVNSSLN